MQVAITGANSYIGQELTVALLQNGLNVKPIVRAGSPRLGSANYTEVDYKDPIALRTILKDCDALVHLVGKAHAKGKNDWSSYYEVNVSITAHVIRAAREAGINKIVYMSSVKALGEQTTVKAPFSHLSKPNPQDNYGKTKLIAERLLEKECENTDVNWFIVRAPLVWSKNPKGNLASLIKLAKLNIPLPFEGLENQRDWISIENLCDFVGHLLKCNGLTSGTYLVTDGSTQSTSESIKSFLQYNGYHVRFFSLPKFIWRTLNAFPLTKEISRKLTERLKVDTSHTLKNTGWSPSEAKNSGPKHV